jgi:hypothetical protein
MSRRGTAQAGFPEDRGLGLAGAVVITLLIAWMAINRGPYGGPITTFGAVMRTLVLLGLAAIPVAALVWAWKRLSRSAQRIVPVPIGVLVAFLGLYAVAHAGIYAERVRMGTDPAQMAQAATGRGNNQFLAVSDSTNAVNVPPVLNRCIINKYGFRTIAGTDGMTVSPAHGRYRQAAAERAERYNNVVIQRLRIPSAEVNRYSDGSDGCGS